MDRQRERKIGTIIGFISTFVAALVSVVYIPLLLRLIGKSEYGLYQLIGSVIAYFSTMYSSLSTAVVRYYSKYLANKDEKNMSNILAISRWIYRGASIVVIIVAIPVIICIAKIYAKALTAWELKELIIMFAIMIANLLIYFSNAIYLSVIIAHEKFVFRKSLDLISQCLQPVVVVLLLMKYKNAVVIVSVQLLFSIVIALLNYFFSMKKLKVSVVYCNDNNNTLVRGLLDLSFSVIVVAIADQIFWKTDQLILGQMYGTTVVAVYSVGSQINAFFISIGCVIPGVCLPMITKTIEKKASNLTVSQIFTKLGRYQAYILFLIDTGVVLFGKELILILAGKDFCDSYYVALLLMLPYTFDLLQTHGHPILQAKDIYKYRTYVMIGASIINIALTVIWAKRYGMFGAALATTVSIGLSMGIIMNIIYSKKAGIDIKNFWKNVLWIVLGAFIAFIFGFLGIRKIHVNNIITQFVIHIILFILLYCLIMFFIIMNKDEKAKIREILYRLKRRD